MVAGLPAILSAHLKVLLVVGVGEFVGDGESNPPRPMGNTQLLLVLLLAIVETINSRINPPVPVLSWQLRVGSVARH